MEQTSTAFLCTWLETNRSFLNEIMLKHGAVLIRGSEIASCVDFERAVLSFQPGLSDCYRGSHLQGGLRTERLTFSPLPDVPPNFPMCPAPRNVFPFLSASSTLLWLHEGPHELWWGNCPLQLYQGLSRVVTRVASEIL